VIRGVWQEVFLQPNASHLILGVVDMITIGEYFKPTSVQEAYELLTSKKKAALIGGGAWIMLGSRRISRAIDLSQAGLKYINDNDNEIEIGAMTTFGDIDRNEIMHRYFNGIIPRSFQDIVGMQLRNIVTVGGTVYSRFGFSDFNTALMVLDCQVALHANGAMSIIDFMAGKAIGPDMIEKVVVKKDEELKASCQMMRNSKGDFAILNVAVSKKGDSYKIAVGARPRRAVLAQKAMAFISATTVDETSAAKAGELAALELELGNNSLAGSEYRKELCKVLVKRAILEVVQ
jgi:CO/xanthine dehydrogenase FAD-binding subunit